MKTIIVAPHPDDELLGCGGTLLRRTAGGGSVGWILVTACTEAGGWSQARIQQRRDEIEAVRRGLGIAPDALYQLGFPAAQLDEVPMGTLIGHLSEALRHFQPEEILLPHPGDAHSDHRISFEAASACTKWFRYPGVKRVMTYETLSETNFGFDPVAPSFTPNLFVDISDQLEDKLRLLSTYASEMAEHPFPRSDRAVDALARLRGSQMGVQAAEAFQVLRAFE